MASRRVWHPGDAVIQQSNLHRAMQDRGVDSYPEFHRWSVTDRAGFWADAIGRIGIVFSREPDAILGNPANVERPRWLDGARLNIAESCFTADPHAAAVKTGGTGSIRTVTSGELRSEVAEVAAGLGRIGIGRGDRVAIAMPMTYESVVAYLAVVWIGGVVVSIADSFAPDEIGARLRITSCDTVVTQDVFVRAGKQHPMYAKVVEAGAARAIVIDTGGEVSLRTGDLRWPDLFGAGSIEDAVQCDPYDATNVLFSSGTTGDPKAIPWTHLTPIKAATDGFYHQDIHPGDVVAWPTNLGWMMGPWLIYASLVNGAAMALYDGAPHEAGFGRFVEEAGVTMLGVVPSLVAAWRATGSIEGRDWSAIRSFSSTGEASNASDMSYLMDLAGGKPVIEYCGGTELGGGYIAGTVVQTAVASQFSTPALGIDVEILDENGTPADNGEVFLVPPSIGMSETLLNRDHHDVYYDGVPAGGGRVLRRHGDHMERVGEGYYRALGRVDDTMNLGGIKVSSAEIERVAITVDGLSEAAAIAVNPPGGGPSRLVVFVVIEPGRSADPGVLKSALQGEIRTHLNPLFKVHDVVAVPALPRTASNKVMRRVLRDSYSADGS